MWISHWNRHFSWWFPIERSFSWGFPIETSIFHRDFPLKPPFFMGISHWKPQGFPIETAIFHGDFPLKPQFFMRISHWNRHFSWGFPIETAIFHEDFLFETSIFHGEKSQMNLIRSWSATRWLCGCCSTRQRWWEWRPSPPRSPRKARWKNGDRGRFHWEYLENPIENHDFSWHVNEVCPGRLNEMLNGMLMGCYWEIRRNGIWVGYELRVLVGCYWKWRFAILNMSYFPRGNLF